MVTYFNILKGCYVSLFMLQATYMLKFFIITEVVLELV